MKKIISVLCAALVVAPAISMAKPGFSKKFAAAYPNSKLTGCTICHNDGDYSRNSYGLALEGAKLDYKAIEQLDSDGDGMSNLDEINAGTFPGDAKSNPPHQEMINQLQSLSNEDLEIIMNWINSK